MSTITKKWLAMALILHIGVLLITSCSNEDEPGTQSRMKKSPYVGVWASTRFIASQTDGHIIAFELCQDGTGADGIWDSLTEEFIPDDYIWEWYVKDDQFYHIENGYKLSRTVEIAEDGTTYTIYDDDNPKDDHYETFIKLR